MASLWRRRAMATTTVRATGGAGIPLELVELDGLMYEEAAGRLGLKRNTLASRIHRARQLLRKALLKNA